MSSLLLNADYTVLGILGPRDALMSVITEDSEMVEPSEIVWHSAGGLEFPVPSVLRLKEYHKVPTRARLAISRKNVLLRDNGLCAYRHCSPVCEVKASTMDHVVPRSKGGKHLFTNLVAACRTCNSKKDDKTIQQMGWTLVSKPYTPAGKLFSALAELENPHPTWVPYLQKNVV